MLIDMKRHTYNNQQTHMNMMRILSFLVLMLSLTLPLLGSSSLAIPIKSRLVENDVPFNGTLYLKAALISSDASQQYWSNDGTGVGGSATEPSAGVPLQATEGSFTLWLGQTSSANMQSLDANAFTSGDIYLRLWLSTDGSSYTQLSPDKTMGAEAYAIYSHIAGNAQSLNGVTASSFGESLLQSTDASTTRSLIGTGTIATQNANSVSITGGALNNVTLDSTNLTVAGTANINGLIMPSSDGTSNQVIITNGQGTLVFKL